MRWIAELLISLNLVAHSQLHLHPAQVARNSAESIQTYHCAWAVASVFSSEVQPGPVFARQQLAFTSVDSQGDRPILMVSQGGPWYGFALNKFGTSRIRFSLPGAAPNQTYFISYLHDSRIRSRVFEFSYGRPPNAFHETDFQLVFPFSSERILPQVRFSIMETAQEVLNLVTEGKVGRAELKVSGLAACKMSGEKVLQMTSGLRHKLDVLEMVAAVPIKSKTGAALGSRMPASIATPVAIDLSRR
jgi:hypothetical protein